MTLTLLHIVHRLVFYLQHMMDGHTSQETRYVSATSPTGQCDLYACDDGTLI
jgi:hypothetical protein